MGFKFSSKPVHFDKIYFYLFKYGVFHPNFSEIISYDFTQIIDIFNNFVKARTVDFHQRHRTALTAAFFEFDLDITPNPTVRFQISNIR